jgi:integrase
MAVRIKRRWVNDPATRKRHLTRTFYTWVPDGRGGKRLVTTDCADRKAAEVRAAVLEREAVDPAYAAANTTTLQFVLDDYAASRKRLRRSEGTLQHVKVKAGHVLRVLRDVLGILQVRDLSHVSMVRYVEHRQAEGARDTTIKKELRVFGGAWKLARRNQLVRQPLEELMPELADDYEPGKRALTPWEVMGLASVLPPERMAVVAFAVATGCDPGALWRACSADVADDFVSCKVHGTKRKTRDRTVPLPLPEQRTLLEWAVDHADGGIGERLFSMWTNMRRDLHAACDKLGIARCSPNDLRRTYGTWLRAEGIEPQLIGAAMGHTDSRMVERVYGRLPSEALAKLLSQRVIRASVNAPTATGAASEVMPAGKAIEEPIAPSPNEEMARELVRYLSGRALHEGAKEDIVVTADHRKTPVFAVRRGGIEPPTRGFSVPATLWPAPRKSRPRRTSRRGGLSPVHQLPESGTRRR